MPDIADPVVAYLAEVRARSEQPVTHAGSLPITHPGVRVLMESAGDVPALLDALEAVLKEHCKTTLYALSVLAHDNQEPPRVWCGHTYAETENSRHLMADDDSILCLDKPEAAVCASCYEGGGEQVEWPCPTYRAISAKLLGSETAPAGDG